MRGESRLFDTVNAKMVECEEPVTLEVRPNPPTLSASIALP